MKNCLLHQQLLLKNINFCYHFMALLKFFMEMWRREKYCGIWCIENGSFAVHGEPKLPNFFFPKKLVLALFHFCNFLDFSLNLYDISLHPERTENVTINSVIHTKRLSVVLTMMYLEGVEAADFQGLG